LTPTVARELMYRGAAVSRPGVNASSAHLIGVCLVLRSRRTAEPVRYGAPSPQYRQGGADVGVDLAQARM